MAICGWVCALRSTHTCVHGCTHKPSFSVSPSLPCPSKYQPRKKQKTSHHSFYRENMSKVVNINNLSALTDIRKIKCLLFPVRLLWRNDRVINIHNHSLSNKWNSKVDWKSLHKLHPKYIWDKCSRLIVLPIIYKRVEKIVTGLSNSFQNRYLLITKLKCSHLFFLIFTQWSDLSWLYL